ncbi:MAG: signal peptidase II [Myxococcota bacterium]|nr:signal peptidase II [Myxococcota bacterium]
MQRYRLLIIGSTITIILDQITKIWAVRALSRLNGTLPETAREIRTQVYVVFESWFNFRLTGNKGAAWGIFGGLPDGWRVPFFVVIGVVAIAVIIGIYRSSDGQNLVRWALTLVLGGAIGNLIDRVRLGYVIDFIDWHYKTHHWPTFNIADVAISVGVGLLILDMIVNRDRDAESDSVDESIKSI